LKIKVSQGSVATRLMCGGIFNDQFVSQSVLSLLVKNIENRSTFNETVVNSVLVILTHAVFYARLIDTVVEFQ